MRKTMNAPRPAVLSPTLLDAAAIRAAVPLADAIAAMERAFASLGGPSLHPPQSLGTRAGEGTFHVKVCASVGGALPDLYVAKINANFPANPVRHGLPTIQGVVVLFDSTDGRILALLDSAMVTSLRTAATTAVAIRHLAPPQAEVATLAGCGVQGRAHAEALREVLPEVHLRVYDTDPAKARAFAEWVRSALGKGASAAPNLGEATRASQVIVTCTPSLSPILRAGDVPPGALVCAVGADNEQKAEMHVSLLEGARVVTDLSAQCAKIGDLRQAVEAGHDPGRFVRAELSDIVTGRRVARDHPDDIVVFDSTGLAIEDLALGALVLDGAGRNRRPAGSPG
jgi:ornithine cyclodeaminase/alanine dehydrogenase-like protein (mu-crystallin family)